MKLLYLTFLIVMVYAEELLHPLSDEFIDNINKQNLSWRAGRNFHKTMQLPDVKGLLGVWPDQPLLQLDKVRPTRNNNETAVPDTFDARIKWKNCESIRTIRDQSNCGACWAFASVEAMSDRICIFSNQTKQIFVSAEDLLTCCGDYCGGGCNGGYTSRAWIYWNTHGIVTGGSYEKDDGCKAYTIPPCNHNKTGIYNNCTGVASTPECERRCDDFRVNYTSERTYGKKPYNVMGYEKDIQLEIMKNGPVVASFEVYDDLFAYKSGVYVRSNISHYAGAHAVKILGWGIENNISYWLAANSWNEDWGDEGFFKILRGKDHCGIESAIVAGIPDFAQNSTDNSDHNSTSYATTPTNSVFLVMSCIYYFMIHH